MKRAALTLLAALGVAAGLAVTASSTSHQAYAAGMRDLALAALVVVLEVTNTLGTLVWLTDTRPHAKWQAGVLVACSSAVTAVCGALTYGPIGLVGPFFVLAGVHLANLAATTPARPPARAAQQVRVIARVPLPPALPPEPPTRPEPVGEASASRPVAQAPVPTPTRASQPSAPARASAPTDEAPTPAARPTPAPRLTDEEIVAQLLARPTTPGRDAICSEFRCGKTKAERVLATLADRRRPHLVTTREDTAR